ncbi:hypothetical protein [Actinocorallia sp. A-T 12471]|uniref:DUF7927 domain-containing protein n=1 Tax=Actinocorallia sp. A-T 12471 TaxID=3089813 RepID=UPI0029D3A2A4|nr:hypothetical protein [Actinocorallia sp. A-T 12471]MDX6740004.1 hypothetical protein [Actinocorallia sp. A-T 12471]
MSRSSAVVVLAAALAAVTPWAARGSTVAQGPRSSVTVAHTWLIDGIGYPDGARPEGFAAVLSLTGPGGLPASRQPSGVPRAGYAVGEPLTVDAHATIPEEGCSVTSQRLTGVNGRRTSRPLPYRTAATASRAYRITTSVVCTTGKPELTVVRDADAATPEPGQTVTHTVFATNTGDGDFTAEHPAVFSDDLTGLPYAASYNGDATATSGEVSYGRPAVTWTGPLEAGASTTIQYTVTVSDGRAQNPWS